MVYFSCRLAFAQELVKDPGFNEDSGFWEGMESTRDTSVYYSAPANLKISGIHSGGNTYLRSTPSYRLKPNYFSGWLKVDSIESQNYPVHLGMSEWTSSGKEYITNNSFGYDFARMGTWQHTELFFCTSPNFLHFGVQKKYEKAIKEITEQIIKKIAKNGYR